MTRPVHFRAPRLDTRLVTVDWLATMCALGASYLGSGVWQAEDDRPARTWFRERGIETEGCSAPAPDYSLAATWGGRLLEGTKP